MEEVPTKDIYNCYRTKNSPGPYPCFHCGKKFTNYFLYRKHAYLCRKTIRVAFPKTCGTCGIHFRSAAHHALHNKKKTYCRPQPFTCQHCGKIFKNIHKLILHEKRKTPCTKYFNSSMAKPTPPRVKKAPPAPLQGSPVVKECPEPPPAKPLSSNFTCDRCGRHLPNSYILRRHQMSSNCTGNISRPGPKPQNFRPIHRRPHAATTFRTRQILKKYKKNYYQAPKLIPRQSLPSGQNSGEPQLPKCPSPVFSSSMLMSSSLYEHWQGLKQSRTQECFCPFCRKRFLYLRSRNRHVQQHHSDNPAQVRCYLEQTTCQICLRLFPTEESKQSHVKMEHTGVSIDAPAPEAPFPLAFYPSTRKRNRPAVPITPQLEAQLKKYPNTCAICGKQYCNTFVRDRHLKSHTLEKPFQCAWCPSKFMRSEQLTQHLQIKHEDSLNFQCKACGLKFSTRVRTSQHISKIHKDAHRDSLMLELKKSKPAYRPVEVEKKKPELFAPQAVPPPKTSKLNGFVSCRKEDDPGKGLYSCTLCEITTFSKMSTLRRHLKSKPHRDKMMELGFAVKNEAPEEVKEEVVEETEKVEEIRYGCSVCQMQFTSAASFIPHRLSHQNGSNSNENFECEICSQVLSQAEKIQTHLLSHMKQERSRSAANRPPAPVALPVIPKPYSCSKCQLGFTTKQHLTNHTRRYCTVKVTCAKCNMKFTSMRHYGMHKVQCFLPSRCQYCSLEVGPGPKLAWHEKSCLKVHQSPEDPVLDRLRTNFSRLLFMLVGDPELMATLGWGKRPLEAVLGDVLRHLDREPQARSPGHDPLAVLRADITTLLQASLQDHLLAGISCVDGLVEKLLELSDTSS